MTGGVEAPPIEGLEGWLAEIEDKGYVVIPDFISPEEVAKIHLAFDTEVRVMPLLAPYLGNETGKSVRGHNLLAKTRAVDYLFLDPRLRGIVEGRLGPHVQINICTSFNLLPGETRQNLHQDDSLWPIPRPRPEFLCNALIAISDFDEENGGTHVVPYSHKWHDREIDQKIETTQVTMKAGSMVVWAGSLWHAGGANVSKNRERLGLFMSHSVSYLRQQENQTLAVPPEIVKNLPHKLQRLIGYFPFGGGIDFRDPLELLKDGQVINPEAKVAQSGWCKI
jgi:ectoine hydroxylase-related dioxygenase (phytanoyl-CoA dioxygenase family)